MNVYYFNRTYASWGPSVTRLDDVLQHFIDGRTFGIQELMLDVHFATAMPPKETLETLYEQFRQTLTSLPKVRYEKRKERLTIKFKSERGLDEDIVHQPAASDDPIRQLGHTTRPRKSSPSDFRAAFGELEGLLRSLMPRLKGKPGLKYAAFVDEVARVRAALPQSDAELVELYQSCAARRRAVIDVQPWWQRLGIEWDDYHPNARRLLDDPLFWDATNDTWFDVLAEFKKWRPRHRDQPPSRFMAELFRAWGVGEGARPEDDDLTRSMRNEAYVALALAQIKVEGGCDPDVRDNALAAIARQIDEGSVGVTEAERDASDLGRLRERLRTLA